jgi:hypothetical protein
VANSFGDLSEVLSQLMPHRQTLLQVFFVLFNILNNFFVLLPQLDELIVKFVAEFNLLHKHLLVQLLHLINLLINVILPKIHRHLNLLQVMRQ